jgi:hypothetical protein
VLTSRWQRGRIYYRQVFQNVPSTAICLLSHCKLGLL